MYFIKKAIRDEIRYFPEGGFENEFTAYCYQALSGGEVVYREQEARYEIN